MAGDRANEITRILNESADDVAAELLPLVYAELRVIARRRLSEERPGQSLQATELVHEAFLRLVGGEWNFENRRHFFAAAAQAMRRILVEQARRRSRVRHGGAQRRTETGPDEIVIEVVEPAALLDLDAALDRLEDLDEGMASVVKLRYFAGLSVEETANVLEISPRAVNRYWTAARAWLNRQLGPPGDSIGG